ncbi:FecR domain-containing protein [Paracrocinitomix mangrovi]|uniref:FecR family protein n=1 Tax=Paracrocinitomix mangrovi TaxID=2862509 RepID=UPI001C8EDFCC|nr:FecR domain-containing protein [Paracrocinitomix mangrovi]UKN01077.1 FecR domain-containing protein [Paracrocinitomix mangrovi]
MSYEDKIDEAILLAYLNKELSTEEMTAVDLWLAKSSDNMKRLNDIRKVWSLTADVKVKPADVDTDAAWNKVLSQINDQQQVIPIQKNIQRSMFIRIAAAIVVLIGVAGAYLFLGKNEEIHDLTLTADNGVLTQDLEDGTTITLNKNSVLTYPENFEGDERRVALQGECFFDVERNEEKPFIIDLPNESYVKVLGTSFNIKAVEGDELTEVYVNSGKVEFGNNESKVLLTAGQKALMNNADGSIQKIDDRVEGMTDMFWMDKYLEFDGESMEEVVQILNRVYQDQVIIECDKLKSKTIRSVHRGEELVEVLQVLKSNMDFEIEEQLTESGNTYFLKCND